MSTRPDVLRAAPARLNPLKPANDHGRLCVVLLLGVHTHSRLIRFSDADKHRILEEAARSGTRAEVARRYGIAGRLLRRWKQELAATAPAFVTVQITDAAAQSGAALTAEGTVS
jgi:hypothetical protein